MNFTPEQVDLIVQQVLEHLGRPAAAPAGTTAAQVTSDHSASSQLLRIDEHVITQALLAESVNGAARISIAARAILTPSARDFVRTRGIEIVREQAQKTVRALSCQVIVATSSPQVGAILEALKVEGIIGEGKLSGTPAEAAALATSALCRGEAERACIVIDQPEHAACLANRNDRIRAAAVGDVRSVERILKAMQANLVAIDPTGRSASELKSLFKAFAQSG